MKNKTIVSSIFWIVLLIFSCKEDEKPANGNGRISITGIDLIGSTSIPGAKVSAENIWMHQLEESLNLNFTDLETGSIISLLINPEDFSKPYELDLPFGFYSITSNLTNSDYSNFLPLEIDEKIQVGVQNQPILLKAKTEFGLVTITKENLHNIPFIVSNPSVKFIEEGSFFYLYIKENQSAGFNFELNSGENSFRQVWKSAAFKHQHYTLDDLEKPDDVQVFKQTDFELNQTIIPLSSNGLPSTLSPITLADLPTSQNESSGLAWIQNRLFSINDGGNTNQIFELNPETGSVISSVLVKNASNVDWEDLAQSDTHLFVGDFGNNSGNRTDLSIFKIGISELLHSAEVDAEKISFTFSDQIDFSGNVQNHNFDCEGMVFWNGKLHLFSKNLGDLKTKHYVLNQEKGIHQAILTSSFEANGLITAAAIEKISNSLVLLGYENNGNSSQVFLWLFSDYLNDQFFTGEFHRLQLGSPANLSQTEGLIFQDGFTVLISGEKISLGGLSVPAKLHKIDLTGLF